MTHVQLEQLASQRQAELADRAARSHRTRRARPGTLSGLLAQLAGRS